MNECQTFYSSWMDCISVVNKHLSVKCHEVTALKLLHFLSTAPKERVRCSYKNVMQRVKSRLTLSKISSCVQSFYRWSLETVQIDKYLFLARSIKLSSITVPRLKMEKLPASLNDQILLYNGPVCTLGCVWQCGGCALTSERFSGENRALLVWRLWEISADMKVNIKYTGNIRKCDWFLIVSLLSCFCVNLGLSVCVWPVSPVLCHI